MAITRITLPALALGLLLAASAQAQHHHPVNGKVGYDPEPRGGDPNTPEGCQGVEAKITISGMSFSPATVTVDPGQPVCWTWSTSDQHSVKADDGSFSNGEPNDHATYQHTFNTPGSFGYFCQVHGSPTGGMRGRVIVRGSGPSTGSGRGTVGLAAGSYSVDEGAGAVTVTVERTDGSDGVATVKLATANGSAKGGKDFTPRTATLRWESGEDGPKSVDVPIKADSAQEPDETFTVKLSKATGATLGTAAAVVTIHDGQGSGCGASTAAPSQVRAAGTSSGEVRLSWDAEPESALAPVRIERRLPGGEFREVATVAAGAGGYTDSGLPAGTVFQYRLRSEAGESAVIAGATDGAVAACDEARSLCLGNGRFEVKAEWRRSGGEAFREARRAAVSDSVEGATSSGLLSLEPGEEAKLLLNVHDGCAANDRFWIDLAAVTEAEVSVSVRDTQTGKTWAWSKAAGSPPATVRDVEAFATCP